MSRLDRIAQDLRLMIKDRQKLAVGTAQFAAVEGNTALFTTPSGTISAIATNFCYGTCLLAKVDGVWYAINPADNREVVRSSVGRFIQRKPNAEIDPTPFPAFITNFIALQQIFSAPSEQRDSELLDIARSPQPILNWNRNAIDRTIYVFIFPKPAEPVGYVKIEIELSLDITPTDSSFFKTSGILYVGADRDPVYPPLLFVSGCYLTTFPLFSNLSGNKITFTLSNQNLYSFERYSNITEQYSYFAVAFINAFATAGLEELMSGKTAAISLLSVSSGENLTALEDVGLGNTTQSFFIP